MLSDYPTGIPTGKFEVDAEFFFPVEIRIEKIDSKKIVKMGHIWKYFECLQFLI